MNASGCYSENVCKDTFFYDELYSEEGDGNGNIKIVAYATNV